MYTIKRTYRVFCFVATLGGGASTQAACMGKSYATSSTYVV